MPANKNLNNGKKYMKSSIMPCRNSMLLNDKTNKSILFPWNFLCLENNCAKQKHIFKLYGMLGAHEVTIYTCIGAFGDNLQIRRDSVLFPAQHKLNQNTER